METPDFLVVQPSMVQDDPSSFENVVNGVYTNSEGSASVAGQYEVANQVLLGSVPNSLFDGERNDNLHIKVEHIESVPDIMALDATDDENVAVEALRQLGNSDYSSNRPKVEGSLGCPHCNQTLPSQHELEEHVALCNLSKSPIDTVISNICPICNAGFDRKNDLNNHLVCHAVERPHACRICGALFIQKQDLLDHVVIHGSQANQCKICGQQFSRPSSLTNHMKIHNYQPGRAMNISRISNTNELEDILTGNSDPELQSVQKSQKNSLLSMTSSNSQWNVNYEPDIFTTGMNLSDINPNLAERLEDVDKNIFLVGENHRTDVAGTNNIKLERPYVCDKCSKGFAREKALLNHMNLHIHDQDFSCERCDQNFGNATTLGKHLQFCGIKPAMKSTKTANDNIQQESNERKVEYKLYKHVCDQCNKSFPTKQKLFRHVWIHRKKSYTCEVCSSIFDTDENLKNHRLATHQPTSPYVCLKCGKNFCTRQGLWEHERTHTTNVNCFRCEECNKTFSSRQGYLIHQRKHADERPYGCKYCQKSFRDGGTLRKHERIHTGERPHVCPICTKAFNQKVVLREHVRVHAANTPLDSSDLYPCALCTSKFGDKEELSAHLVHHSDKLAQMAKDAYKNIVIAKQQKVVLNKKEATEVKVVVASKGQGSQDELVEETVDDPDFVQLQQKEMLRLPELKMECVISEDLNAVTGDNHGNQSTIECDLCGVTLKSKEEHSSHIRMHIQS